MFRAHQIGLALMLLLAGYLFVVQVRANQAFLTRSVLPSRRLEDLTVLVRRQQESDRVLRDEVAQLERKLEEYRTAAARGRGVALEMQTELARLREALALTAVHGQGLEVVIRVPPGRVAVPQAQDLAGLVNELWAAGAEAVALNGIRLRATDGVLQQGGAIRIEGKTLRDPYRLLGIGDPEALEGALLVRGGLIDGLRGVGLAITVSRHEDVVLPPRTGGATFHIARPTTGP